MRQILMLGIATLTGVVAYLAAKRRPDPPSVPSYRAPLQLDPADIVKSSEVGKGFVVVFASRLCESCSEVWAQVEGSGFDEVSKHLAEVEDDPKLHERYGIDGVPTTLIARPDGEVVGTFFGPIEQGLLAESLGQL